MSGYQPQAGGRKVFYLLEPPGVWKSFVNKIKLSTAFGGTFQYILNQSTKIYFCAFLIFENYEKSWFKKITLNCGGKILYR